MRIAITGAKGFLGSAVTAAALARGYEVRALLRPGSSAQDQPWASHPQLSVHAVALAASPELVAALRGVDVVIHVAAALANDEAKQQRDTIEATQHLLTAMREAGVPKLIGISSFAVYDYVALPVGSLLDESSATDSSDNRGSYARAKLRQEALVRGFIAEPGHHGSILRPSIIYDHERLWDFALGRALGGKAWLVMGPEAAVPLVHVADTAEAILLAAESNTADGAIFNLVEDRPSPRHALLAALNAKAQPPRVIVRFPWALHRLLAAVAGFVAKRIRFRRLPGLLDPAELAVRFKPLRYGNAAARRVLAWEPRRNALDDVKAT